MFTRMIRMVKNSFMLVGGVIFVIVAAMVIHFSGLDRVDSTPTPEGTQNYQKFTPELKEKYGN